MLLGWKSMVSIFFFFFFAFFYLGIGSSTHEIIAIGRKLDGMHEPGMVADGLVEFEGNTVVECHRHII